MKRKKIFITAALTGAVHVPSMSPYLPVTPQELADEAVRAYEAGASTVHIHTKSKTGEPDASLDLMRETLKLIKVRCDVVCCVTTGASQLMTLEERLAPVSEFKPELATLNAGSMNFVLSDIAEKIPDGFGWEKPYLKATRGNVFSNSFNSLEAFIETMNKNGTRPEFEVYDVAMINNIAYFIREGIIRLPVYMQFRTWNYRRGSYICGKPELLVRNGLQTDRRRKLHLVRSRRRKTRCRWRQPAWL